MKHPTGPNPGFIVITDCDGDVATTLSPHSTIEHIYAIIRFYDQNNPADAPHSPWQYSAGGFIRIFD